MLSKIYRCRLCKEILIEETVNEIKANIEFSNLKDVELKRHYCSDGGLGVSELIGYKEIEIEKKNYLD